ncbi:hypothetical protein BOTBODRAFT_31525 [Botryobasidium botryosum FD-172 SS1]|uniref:PhoX domain-containing protein n=1 Tax=Botryobasidium botryosum (strain FD-172 SS1) TaxID=930990 RepID=A0A067MIL8_BOTB1|nr:hypothetical protein BOTBODRAFT_31525 [Botryobasidium botryosum FD-172 SS1]
MTSSSLNSHTGWILVGVLSVVLPLAARVFSSPVILILFSPLLVLLLAIAYVLFNILISYALDSVRARSAQPTPNHLLTAARPLTFSTPAAWQAAVTRSQWSTNTPQSLPPLCPEALAISGALNDILTLIVRDFVLTWYTKISSSPAFPTSVSSTLHATVQTLLARIETLDVPAVIVRRILPKVTAHIEQFRQSEVSLRGAGLERHLTQADELDLLLARRYAGKGGKLHPAVDNLSSMVTKQTEDAYLRGLVDKILPFILPESEAESKAVRIVVREIVACAVLGPVLDMFADPDFWNRIIDQVAGAAIRQQKMISKVRHILEAQSPVAAVPVSVAAARSNHRNEKITSRTAAHHFESFLRSIGRCESLLDARRLKNDVMVEIRRTRALLANHEKDEWIDGQKTEDVVAYLDRLYTAKRKAEARIAVLGGVDESGESAHVDTGSPASRRLKLRDVLSNPSSLSYFMEFMDRRARSLLVQFWLTVESFKDPLEFVDSDAELSEDEDGTNMMSSTATLSSSTNAREDMTLIHDLYFASLPSSPLISVISPKYIDIIRSYVMDTSATSASKERRVRRGVLLAQRQVEHEMEEDFIAFERSELWFKVVGDLDREVGKKGSPAAHENRLSASVGELTNIKDARALSSPESPAGLKTLSRPRASTRVSIPRPKFLVLPSRTMESIPPSNDSQLSPSPSLSPALSSSSPNLHRADSWETSGSRPVSIPPHASDESLSRPRSAPSNLEFLISANPDASAEHSRAPLFDDPEIPAEELEQAQRIEAIQAALTDIFADEKHHSERLRSVAFLDETPSSGSANEGSKVKGKKKSGRVFDDDEYEDEDADEDEGAEAEDKDDSGHGSFQLAAPGDLQLSYDIARLGEQIAKLQSQDLILDTLIRKAELTGDAHELRLLTRSKSAMAREQRQLVFQKMQYEQQEFDNRLVPERTHVSIGNSVVSEDEGAKQVVKYLVEVQLLAADGSFASGWVVARRYNEFFTMHQRLKDKYVVVRSLDFPGKKLVTSMSTSFLDTRRVALERYLQSLVQIALICESEELRAFLSRQPNADSPEPGSRIPKSPGYFPGKHIVRNVYRSVAESIDDMFLGPSMLDVMIQRLSRQAAELAGIAGAAMHDEDLIAQALKSSGRTAPEDTLAQLPGSLKPLEGESSTSSFISPICDLILAVFELDKKNNWLRRQAVVIILQQVLGGTIERKLRDVLTNVLDEGHLLSYVGTLRENLWPGGKLKSTSVPRTPEEKVTTREDANRKLSAFMPDIAANMIGRSNARRGARRMFTVLQNRRLNQHIIYSVVDEVFAALFPETVA